MMTHSRKIIFSVSDVRILIMRLSDSDYWWEGVGRKDDSLNDEGGWQVVPEVGDQLPAAARAVGHLELLEAAQLDQVREAARGQRGAAWGRGEYCTF